MVFLPFEILFVVHLKQFFVIVMTDLFEGRFEANWKELIVHFSFPIGIQVKSFISCYP